MALNSYSYPFMLFESLIADAFLLSSSFVDNEEHLHDGITSTFATFQSGSIIVYDFIETKSFDAIGISKNTMSTAGAFVIFYGSDDNVSYTHIVTVTTEDNKTKVVQVAASYRYLKIICASNSSFNIANIYVGKKVVIPTGMQSGFTPPRYNSQDTLNPNTTSAGNLAGVTLLNGGYDAEISLKYLNPNWVRTYADTIIEGVKKGPFFFVWDAMNYPDECMFCWAKSDVPKFSYSGTFLMESSISVNGIV